MNHATHLLTALASVATLCLPTICTAQDAGLTELAVQTAEAGAGWRLVWQDEFDGQTLDYSKWGVEQNAFGGGNEELQIYTDRAENVRVEAGCLVLEARRDNTSVSGTEREYSSGRVRTKHRGDWKYGRVEIRAKLAKGAGIWPAIWMLPTDERYGGWAASGEDANRLCARLRDGSINLFFMLCEPTFCGLKSWERLHPKAEMAHFFVKLLFLYETGCKACLHSLPYTN